MQNSGKLVCGTRTRDLPFPRGVLYPTELIRYDKGQNCEAALPLGPSGETRTRGILLPKQARYQLRYTRITYFVVVNYVVKMILPQKGLTFKRGKVAEFAYKSGKIPHLRGNFQNGVGSPKSSALPTGPHPGIVCIIHQVGEKCKHILQKSFGVCYNVCVAARIGPARSIER